jgi:hypothetical protein
MNLLRPKTGGVPPAAWQGPIHFKNLKTNPKPLNFYF